MKLRLLLVVSFVLILSFKISAQEKSGITFKIEKLSPPKGLVQEVGSKELLQEMFPGLWVSTPLPDSVVAMGEHPFFNGMYKAYAEHRAFELSPDMIWLLISQGFAHHVNNNADALRHMFVDFEGKKSLTVKLHYTASLQSLTTWEDVIPQFIEKAAKSTGQELFADLTPSFSTTTSIEHIATQITALESMKAYFEFIVIYPACGIPEITLKGTPDDWRLVLSKTKRLRKYNLDWWMDNGTTIGRVH